jgi:hypothetical protein
MDLGVAMLSGLGGTHLNNLAGTALDDDMSVLTQSRALHRKGGRSPGRGLLKGVVVLLIVVGHCEDLLTDYVL